MNTQKTEILDFSKLEDQFFCIDVLTRARFSIKNGDTELIADIDKILASFTAIAHKPPAQSVRNTSVDDQEIVDLLTGEKIR